RCASSLVLCLLSSFAHRRSCPSSCGRRMDTARLLFETLLADLSSQFINVDARLVDTAIDEALKHVGELLDVDAGALTQLADRDRALVFTHYWSRTGDVPPYLKVDAGQVLPFGLARLMAGDI